MRFIAAAASLIAPAMAFHQEAIPGIGSARSSARLAGGHVDAGRSAAMNRDIDR